MQTDLIATIDLAQYHSCLIAERGIQPLADPRKGMVQMRWGHINRDYSLLTRLQSVFLDGHFVIEHAARNRSGRYFNFNGTAGMWRASAIADAGGWQHDTVTEDIVVVDGAPIAPADVDAIFEAGSRFRSLDLGDAAIGLAAVTRRDVV